MLNLAKSNKSSVMYAKRYAVNRQARKRVAQVACCTFVPWVACCVACGKATAGCWSPGLVPWVLGTELNSS